MIGDSVQLGRFLVRFSGRARRTRGTIVLVVLAGIVSGLASTALLAVITRALSDTERGMWFGVGAFAALVVVMPLTRFLSNYGLIHLTQRAVHDLRLDLARSILAAPLRRLERHGADRLLATLTDDVGSITAALSTLPLLFMQAAVVAGCLGYLGYMSWRLLLVLLGFMAVGLITYQLPLSRARSWFRKMREDWDAIFRDLRGITHGTKELKLHKERREDFLRDRLTATSERLRVHTVRGSVLHAGASSWGQSLFFILIGIVVFGFDGADREVATAYALCVLYMLTPIDAILNLVPGLQRAGVAVRKIASLGLALGDEEPDRELPAAQVQEGAPWSRLEMDGVEHSYAGPTELDSFVLGPLDLTFTPGELVVVIGGNGSGKTTFAKLLLGLYTPQAGRVLLDGTEIDARSRDDYRQLFSAVFSDFFLFEELLGLERAADEELVESYLRKLRLENQVRVTDRTLSTTELSQGQRKRLALLAAYLEDRSIYVFDEWAADQDPQFKEVFYLQLLDELKDRGKTIIAISHDDRYFGVADRIIKLDYGRVVYDGPATRFKAPTEDLVTSMESRRFTEILDEPAADPSPSVLAQGEE